MGRWNYPGDGGILLLELRHQYADVAARAFAIIITSNTIKIPEPDSKAFSPSDGRLTGSSATTPIIWAN
jgi:hypothetical protein